MVLIQPVMKDIIRSLGLVFGDIGTSPIYTFTVIFLLVKPTPENILGIVSLILWTLTTLVTIQYAWLAMSLGQKSEGGTIVLKEILLPLLKKGKLIAFFGVLAVIGISLLIGDGVITPAISILSAVEGILLIPGFENTSQDILIFIAAMIAIGLFSLQRHGADKVSSAFGPIMVIWFSVLFLSGLIAITYFPRVILAINPYYGLKFILSHGIAGFFVLSEVILCSTGGEALFADMGHMGRMPITKAWFFAFIALATNYLGQAAFLATHPKAQNILFEMIFFQNKSLYIPFLFLSIIATVIASQAIISSMFSIFYQAITTHLLPILKIEYTSAKIKSQIYINFINWLLMLLVLFIMVTFRKSHNLAAAYGLAVNGDMLITGIFMSTI
ncbi:MAG: KUP/HAK/KT family potassium transporter, partial [Candidatus Margulisiibacteriota bacterium]